MLDRCGNWREIRVNQNTWFLWPMLLLPPFFYQRLRVIGLRSMAFRANVLRLLQRRRDLKLRIYYGKSAERWIWERFPRVYPSHKAIYLPEQRITFRRVYSSPGFAIFFENPYANVLTCDVKPDVFNVAFNISEVRKICRIITGKYYTRGERRCFDVSAVSCKRFVC